MYGSIHTHFESDKDAVNASYGPDGKIGFYNALNEFHKLGAKRVAVTEHCSFSSFDDIFDSLGKFKKANPDAEDMEVIPGCEIYFDLKGNNDPADRAHTILIAKDRTGYEQLCKILTRAASTVQSSQAKDYQIVTLENLKESIGDEKGHLICTSACIAGPFAKALIADDIFISEKVEEKRKFLEEADYFSHKEITDIDNQYIATVITKDDILKVTNQLNHSMGGAMDVFKVALIILSAALIYLLAKIIIERNEHSISMTKILGFKNSEIGALYIVPTAIVVVLFALISFVVGYYLMVWIFKIFVMQMDGYFDFYMSAGSMVLSVVYLLIGYGIVSVIDFIRIKKIPMDVALKNVE